MTTPGRYAVWVYSVREDSSTSTGRRSHTTCRLWRPPGRLKPKCSSALCSSGSSPLRRTSPTQHLPILSLHSFSSTRVRYNVPRDPTPAEDTLDQAKYEAYCTRTLPPSVFTVSCSLSFASVSALLSQAPILVMIQSRRSLAELPDIHARLMSRYPEVPDWWYACIFLSMFTFGVISIEVWPSELPVWAFVDALLISLVHIVPIGMIQAITNQRVGLNVITNVIVSYALPGRPIAMMMFKTWGYIAMAQGLTLSSDLNRGHCMKISIHPMFWAQIVASSVALTTQLGVQASMFTNIHGMCGRDGDNGFICLSTTVFGTASIIWGVIAPANVSRPSKTYRPLLYLFLIGAFAPATPWFLTRRYHTKFF